MNRKNSPLLRPRVLAPLFVVCLSAVIEAGCSRTGEAPAPLPVENIPAAMEKAFGNASADVKGLIKDFDANLQSKDYPAAFHELESLNGLPKLNKDQRLTLARTLLTVTSLLQTAQAQGDQQADAALKNAYRSH